MRIEENSLIQKKCMFTEKCQRSLPLWIFKLVSKMVVMSCKRKRPAVISDNIYIRSMTITSSFVNQQNVCTFSSDLQRTFDPIFIRNISHFCSWQHYKFIKNKSKTQTRHSRTNMTEHIYFYVIYIYLLNESDDTSKFIQLSFS